MSHEEIDRIANENATRLGLEDLNARVAEMEESVETMRRTVGEPVVHIGSQWSGAPEASYQTPTMGEFEERGTESQIAALYAALAAATGEFKPIERSREVDMHKDGKRLYKFEYAPMEELIAATRPALSKHGLVVMLPFTCQSAESACFQNVIIAHKGGARLVYKFMFAPIDGDEKKFGGQTTYLQRYCYRSVLCLAADGDLDDQPTRAGETTASAGPRPNRNPPTKEASRQSEHPLPGGSDSASHVSRTPQTTGNTTTGSSDGERAARLKDVKDAARAVGLSTQADLAKFVFGALNCQPYDLNHNNVFLGALTIGQAEVVLGKLIDRKAEMLAKAGGK